MMAYWRRLVDAHSTPAPDLPAAGVVVVGSVLDQLNAPPAAIAAPSGLVIGQVAMAAENGGA